MRLEGMWENIATSQLLRIISIVNQADDYNLQYGFDGENFNTSEDVRILFIETNKFAKIISKNLGSPYLHINNTDQIRIGENSYKRLSISPY